MATTTGTARLLLPGAVALAAGGFVGYIEKPDSALALLAEASMFTSPILLDHVGVHRNFTVPLQLAGAALLGDRLARDIF